MSMFLQYNCLLGIEKYISETAHAEMKAEDYDKNIEDRFTDPTDEDSTAYGEIKPEQDEPYHQSYDPTYTFAGQGYFY